MAAASRLLLDLRSALGLCVPLPDAVGLPWGDSDETTGTDSWLVATEAVEPLSDKLRASNVCPVGERCGGEGREPEPADGGRVGELFRRLDCFDRRDASELLASRVERIAPA